MLTHRSYTASPHEDPLCLQAWEIIESVLMDEDPELSAVRERLRRHVAAHPGRPDQALLHHMLETSQLANADSNAESLTAHDSLWNGL